MGVNKSFILLSSLCTLAFGFPFFFHLHFVFALFISIYIHIPFLNLQISFDLQINEQTGE